MFPKSRYVTPLTEAKRQAALLRKEIRQAQRILQAQALVKELTLKLVELQDQVRYPDR